MRSVVATLRDLMAQPAFHGHMDYAARREYTAQDRRCRVYGPTCSGNWWWEMQVSIRMLIVSNRLPNASRSEYRTSAQQWFPYSLRMIEPGCRRCQAAIRHIQSM
jgi:hypothetical protein